MKLSLYLGSLCSTSSTVLTNVFGIVKIIKIYKLSLETIWTEQKITTYSNFIIFTTITGYKIFLCNTYSCVNIL